MNIGGGNGSYSHIPMFWEFDNARSFTDFIRDQMFNIILWSHESYGTKSHLWLGVHIVEDIDDENYWEWDFIIYCKNIREFKQYEKLSREDIDLLKIEKKRDEKLNNVLGND